MNKKQIINAISESKDSSQLPRLLEPKFNDKINVLSASKKQNLSRLKSLRIQQKKKYLIISIVSCVLFDIIFALVFVHVYKDQVHSHNIASVNAEHRALSKDQEITNLGKSTKHLEDTLEMKSQEIQRLKEVLASVKNKKDTEIKKMKTKSEEDEKRFKVIKTLLKEKDNELILLKNEAEKEKEGLKEEFLNIKNEKENELSLLKNETEKEKKRLKEDLANVKNEKEIEIKKMKAKSEEDEKRFKILLKEKENEIIMQKNETEKENERLKAIMTREKSNSHLLEKELQKVHSKFELIKTNDEHKERYQRLEGKILRKEARITKLESIMSLLRRDGIVNENFEYPGKGAICHIVSERIMIMSLMMAALTCVILKII